MIRVCVLAMLVCVARAGVIGYDDGHGLLGPSIAVAHAPIAVAHAPVAVAHAPVAVAHAASSYQNSNLLALNPVKVATPVIAAPVITKVAAPIAVAAPIGYGYGKGFALGGYH